MAGTLVISAQAVGNNARERMVQRIQNHVEAGTMLSGCVNGERFIHPGSAFAKALRTEVHAGNLNSEDVEQVVGTENARSLLEDFPEGRRLTVNQQAEIVASTAMVGFCLSEVAAVPPEEMARITHLINELRVSLDGRGAIIGDRGRAKIASRVWELRERLNLDDPGSVQVGRSGNFKV
jgi:hypothetical protein